MQFSKLLNYCFILWSIHFINVSDELKQSSVLLNNIKTGHLTQDYSEFIEGFIKFGKQNFYKIKSFIMIIINYID